MTTKLTTEMTTEMTTKANKVKTLLNGECKKIIVATLTADEFRFHVDMYYTGTKPVDIVECVYDDELCAMPQCMTVEEYNSKTAEQIAGEWEI